MPQTKHLTPPHSRINVKLAIETKTKQFNHFLFYFERVLHFLSLFSFSLCSLFTWVSSVTQSLSFSLDLCQFVFLFCVCSPVLCLCLTCLHSFVCFCSTFLFRLNVCFFHLLPGSSVGAFLNIQQRSFFGHFFAQWVFSSVAPSHHARTKSQAKRSNV